MEIFKRDCAARQIRRAAVSVMSNIAEGFESKTQVCLLSILVVQSSAGELRAQLYLRLTEIDELNEKASSEAQICSANCGVGILNKTKCTTFAKKEHLMMSENFWKNKRIIVTGGAGFLGSFVIQNLLNAVQPIFDPRIEHYDLTIETQSRNCLMMHAPWTAQNTYCLG